VEGDVKKFFVGAAISIGVVAASAAPAFGHDCFNASKQNADAANGGTVVITPPNGFSFTPSGHAGNPAFATVTVTGAGTFENVFAHPAGPHGVLPSADDCDGKGIDSIDACLSQ
jgi:hypothetical protein